MSCLYLLFNLTNDITGWRWWLAGVQGASICRVGKSFCCFKLLYEPFISNSRINTLLQSHKFNFPSCFSRHSNESLDEFLESIQDDPFSESETPFQNAASLDPADCTDKTKAVFQRLFTSLQRLCRKNYFFARIVRPHQGKISRERVTCRYILRTRVTS